MRQIKIGDKWTQGDWGAFLGPSPTIGSPETKTSYVDIPAGNGSIDLTEALADEPVFKDRTLDFDLVLLPPRFNWEHTRVKIANYCHGRRLPIIMPDDPEHYFIGRVEVGELKKEKSEVSATIAIKVSCDPYRYKNTLTVFKQVIPVGGQINLDLKNERKRVMPTFTVSGQVVIIFKKVSYTIKAGAFKLTDIFLDAGTNPITIKGASGTQVQIEYQEGGI